QSSVYSELLPLAGLVVLVWLALTLRRARRHACVRRWAAATAWLLAGFLVCGELEIARAVRALPLQFAGVVGWHVDATVGEWLGLLTGGAVYPELVGPGYDVNPLAVAVGPVLALCLCVAGLLRRSTRLLTLGVAVVVAVLGAAALHYLVDVEDPWTHDTGHTWSLYKLIQWLHPLLILGAWAGLCRFLRRA